MTGEVAVGNRGYGGCTWEALLDVADGGGETGEGDFRSVVSAG
jgi:hypothetical protein